MSDGTEVHPSSGDIEQRLALSADTTGMSKATKKGVIRFHRWRA